MKQKYKTLLNKWQDRLWGPVRGYKKHYIQKTNSKTKIKDCHNSTKIIASIIFGGDQLRFRISAQYVFKQFRYELII